MFKSVNKLAVRAVVEFLVLFLIFCFVGALIYAKVDEALTKSLEESVAQQSQSMAFGIEQQSRHTFNKMRTGAKLAEQGKVSVQDLVSVSLIGSSGETMGIVTENGEVIAGTPLTDEAISILHSAFKGNEIVKYRQNIGLIFAVPINIDGEQCILYNCFDDDAIRRAFRALSYNGAGTLYIHNGLENWILLSKGWYFFL